MQKPLQTTTTNQTQPNAASMSTTHVEHNGTLTVTAVGKGATFAGTLNFAPVYNKTDLGPVRTLTVNQATPVVESTFDHGAQQWTSWWTGITGTPTALRSYIEG